MSSSFIGQQFRSRSRPADHGRLFSEAPKRPFIVLERSRESSGGLGRLSAITVATHLIGQPFTWPTALAISASTCCVIFCSCHRLMSRHRIAPPASGQV